MLNNHQLNINKATVIVSNASTSVSTSKNIETESKNYLKRRECENYTNENVESFLTPWTYSCLFKPAIERVKHSYIEVIHF